MASKQRGGLMGKLVLAILLVSVATFAAGSAHAGNPNCPQPTLPGGIKPKNWSCPTGTPNVTSNRPRWANWPAPYNALSDHPPEACRPYLSDWRKFEKCLLEKAHYPNDLPRLKNGTYEAWGRSNPGYNCYAYAISPYDPTKTWVGSRVTDSSRMSYSDFINVIEGAGWRRVDNQTANRILNSTRNPTGGEERVVIFLTPDGTPQHAALWDARGILAKMGEYGVFRFEKLEQMAGPKYGRPVQVYTNRRN